MLSLLAFVACAAAIGVAGTALSRYGDVIGRRTGMGGSWVGLVLIATVTSLPELATGVSAVTINETPEIAVGDVLGSCVFNLLIIVVLDLLQRGESVYTRARQGHILSAGFGVILIGFAGFNVLLAKGGAHWTWGHVGLYSPVIVVLYAVAMRTVFRYEVSHPEQGAGEALRESELTLKQALQRYAAAALVVVAAGVWLPYVGKSLAAQMGWQQSFVGTLFVAAATSLPEVAVSVAALRIGALDMAIGGLFGSNLFNIAILTIDDALYLKGPLLSNVSTVHAVSAFSAVMMTGVAIVGLLYRPRVRVFRTVGWASIVLFVMYLLNAYLLFLHD
jgi:cation:H+ antiporter